MFLVPMKLSLSTNSTARTISTVKRNAMKSKAGFTAGLALGADRAKRSRQSKSPSASHGLRATRIKRRIELRRRLRDEFFHLGLGVSMLARSTSDFEWLDLGTEWLWDFNLRYTAADRKLAAKKA